MIILQLMTLYCIAYFISLLMNRIFHMRYDKTILCCGIWGGFPRQKRTLNLAKIKMLGRENVTRGRDSCGFYYGGNIQKGTEKEKEFDDFLKLRIIEKGELYPMFLGHTRSASPGITGGYSAFNAHPFEFDNLVLTHNGVIYNIAELLEKYEVDAEGLNVDSHKLGKIIADKGLNVLHDYVGYAALAFMLKDQPEVGYLYHGKSHEMLVGNKVSELCMEERPLHYMQTKEGVYYSSEKDPLMMIRESEDEIPKVLPYNKVYKIVNGLFKVDEKEIYNVDREQNNIKIDDFKFKSYTTYNNSNNFFNKGGQHGRTATNSNFRNSSDLQIIKSPADLPERSMIWNEALPKRATTKINICFNWKSRFWIKKGNITEIELAEGLYYLNKKGELSTVNSVGAKAYYFYKGVMLKGAKNYQDLLSELRGKYTQRACALTREMDKCNIAYYLAPDSAFPVTCLEEEGGSVHKTWKQLWFGDKTDKRENKLSLTLMPKFSSRTYVIENGYLVQIKSSDKNDKKLFDDDETETKNKAQSKALVLEMFPEKYHDRKQMIRNAMHSVFDAKDAILENEDALWVTTEIVKDLFRVDYNYDLTGQDPGVLEFNIDAYIQECINSNITMMENLPDHYDLEKYLMDFEVHLDGLFSADETKTKPEDDSVNADSDDASDTEGYLAYVDRMKKENSEKKTHFMNDKVTPENEDKILENEQTLKDMSKFIDNELYLDVIKRKFEDVKSVTEQLSNLGDVFQSLDTEENDEFVNDVALTIYKTSENLVNEINLLTEKYGLKIPKVILK